MHDQESPENQPDEPASPPSASPDAYAVLRNADYRRYLAGRFGAVTGQQMLEMAVDWELYQRTHSALPLAFVGLSQMAPMFLCTLPAGHFADTFNRRQIILVATLLLSAASLALALCSAFAAPLGWIYACLVVIGAGRTFLWPAHAAFLVSLVSREQFPRAVTFNSGVFQFCCIIAPLLAGWVISLAGHRAWPVYALNALGLLVCFALVSQIKRAQKIKPPEPLSGRNLIEGFRFVFDNKIILGVITLDMFAVLLGGTVAILPIFARDIYHVGPSGLGWLRNAMAIGAVACMFIVAHRPPLQKAGRAMLWAVAVFGVATVLFGLANLDCLGRWLPLPGAVWFWSACALLALAGGVDNISVVVRHSLVQIITPDEKRGRVSAVNSLFIGTSNELGGFRSGLVAYLFTAPSALGSAAATGAIVSTVTGGVGTIVTVLVVAWLWPEIRRYGKLA